MTFDVYFGYRIGTVLKYNVFRVNIVEKSEENVDSDCTKYTDQTTCESAFDGKSCSWNVNFSTCGVK